MWIDFPAIRLPFLALCTSEEQFNKLVKKYGCPIEGKWLEDHHLALTHQFVPEGGALHCVICIRPEKREWYKTAALIAHEAVHVKQLLLSRMAEDNPGWEIEATIVDMAVFALLKEYDRQVW